VQLRNITALLPPITKLIRNHEETVRYIKECSCTSRNAPVHKENNLLAGDTTGTVLSDAVLRIRIRDPVPFWPLDPGSGIGFFRIPDPKPIFFRA
jgi:hypothetical protein